MAAALGSNGDSSTSASGLLETFPLIEGVPIFFEQHWDRLRSSCAALGFSFPFQFETAKNDILDFVLANKENGKTLDGILRLTYVPGSGQCDLHVEFVPPRPALPSMKLLPVPLEPHPLASHKIRDRGKYETARGKALKKNCDDALFLDEISGDILETTRANVFVAAQGRLLTPPADGRILPGIVRQWAINAASKSKIQVEEKKITRRELAKVNEIFVTNSVIGIVPVSKIDGLWEAESLPGVITNRMITHYSTTISVILR